ncbi:hypothetical protein ASG93_04215 [Paenibacillus sp. Soil787]|nr:hypothetical protein ASG93_04215 [Paenibacillus sp. Soil787]
MKYYTQTSISTSKIESYMHWPAEQLSESLELEMEYLLTMLRMFYQRTLRMTPMPNKKEAKESWNQFNQP